jgi:aryl carrier-like protein
MAVDLSKQLRDTLGVDIKVDTLVSGPKVSELAADVLPKIDLTKAAPPLPASSPPPQPASSGQPQPASNVQPRANVGATDRAAIIAFLTMESERMLGFSAGELDARRPLAWQGFDSVMAVDLHARIKQAMGVSLKLDVLTGGPRLDELADEVLKLGPVNLEAGPSSAPTAALAPPVTPVPVAQAPAITPKPAPAGDLIASLAAAPDRRAALLAWLSAETEGLLGFASGEIDVRRPLAWQGFDSVMAVDLQRKILDATGVKLALDGLVSGPRLDELAGTLLPQLTLTAAASPAAASPAAASLAAASTATPAAVRPPSVASAPVPVPTRSLGADSWAPVAEPSDPAPTHATAPSGGQAPGGNPIVLMLLGAAVAAVITWFVAGNFASTDAKQRVPDAVEGADAPGKHPANARGRDKAGRSAAPENPEEATP